MKLKLNSKNTKYLLITLLLILVFLIIYYYINVKTSVVSEPILYKKKSNVYQPIPYEKTQHIIEPFNSNLNETLNKSKLIIIYTASWCPHCRSFMGMSDEDGNISENSEFAKIKDVLGDCFEHVTDKDPDSGSRMQNHGVNGYPGIAFVDKASDAGCPLSVKNRTSDEIYDKFIKLSS